MNKKSIIAILFSFSLLTNSYKTFSMEDDLDYVDDSMLDRLDDQYEDDMDSMDAMDDEDMMPEEDGDEDESYWELPEDEEDEDLPEQDYVVESREMMPQSDVNEMDDTMM